MLIGAAFTSIGYAVFYWGYHHMPWEDKRYPLWTLLGLDRLIPGSMIGGSAVQYGGTGAALKGIGGVEANVASKVGQALGAPPQLAQGVGNIIGRFGSQMPGLAVNPIPGLVKGGKALYNETLGKIIP